jgi:type IV secretion system protein VirD4
VRDVQNIADILVDPEGALERRNHWEKTSHSLLVGAILHILYAEEEKTLARVATFLSDPQRSFVATLRRMMETNHIGTAEAPRVHPVVASAAREVLNKSENERSGVLSTAMSLSRALPRPHRRGGHVGVRLADRRSRRGRPSGVALSRHPAFGHQPHQAAHPSRPQPDRPAADRETRSARRGSSAHQLLMMLDEFPALGRLDFFETSFAFMAGYGVRAFLIAQSAQPDREGLWRAQ